MDERHTRYFEIDRSRLGLWYFQTLPHAVSAAVSAGITTFMVDWEDRGKAERQVDRDTEINHDTDKELRAVASVRGARPICRINGFSPATAAEIDLAVEAGAAMVLLPMARRVGEVEGFLRLVDGRIAAGALIETKEAVGCVEEIAALPLAAAYIGLNDLSISLGTPNIFAAVVDGTVERIASALNSRALPNGWGGVTVVDRGEPIPTRLLMAEMARLGSSFSFLRRSFRRDIADADLLREVERIQSLWTRLKRRSAPEMEMDRASLADAVRRLS